MVSDESEPLCPYDLCDGSGYVEDPDGNGIRTKCPHLLEEEGESKSDEQRGN